MQLLEPSFKIYVPGYDMYKYYVENEIKPSPEDLEHEIFKLYFRDQSKIIEWAGRTAYKSEDRITDESYKTFVKSLTKRNHGACLEFADLTVKFVCSRYITHEAVRHRIPSFLQESTRYVAYDQEKFGGQILTVPPKNLTEDIEALDDFVKLAKLQEELYMKHRKRGVAPETARAFLPSELKTEICIKSNWREWKHIINLRVLGGTGTPAPEMYRLLHPLYETLKTYAPEVFF